jgi:phosphinothricin acetyltransferase
MRAATEADLPAINEIYNYYVPRSACTFDLEPKSAEWRAGWFRDRVTAGYPVLVAERGDVIAGWACLSPWSPKPAYRTTADESIYIDERFHGQGVGRALVGALLAEAVAREIEVVMAVIVACQSASLGLHRSMGFCDVGMFPHMGFKLGEWHDIVYLQRQL